jgi:hypothetical protein
VQQPMLADHPPVISVRPWADPVVDPIGHDPHGAYVELFWLGTLGPTSTWLLRRLVAGFADSPDGYELDLAETATALGLSYAPGRHSPFARALHRLSVFGVAREATRSLAVRRRIPPLAVRQVERLPPGLRGAHAAWVVEPPVPGAERARIDALASVLLFHGDAPTEIETSLARLGIPPALATSAVRRALDAELSRGAA